MTQQITEKEIYDLIHKFINFPSSAICKHNICCELLSLLERKGHVLNNELVKAIVNADDETSIEILSNLTIK